MRFINIGHNNVINVDKVVAVIKPGTNIAKRFVAAAKKTQTYIDCCSGRVLRAVILLDDGRVAGSTLNTRVIQRRFNYLDLKQTPYLLYEEQEKNARAYTDDRGRMMVSLNVPDDEEDDEEEIEAENEALAEEDDPDEDVEVEEGDENGEEDYLQ